VGRAVSHGCVRLLNENVSTLYGQVKLGTPVTVLP
jgi:lipoprotein-anchoring transpeptidase ErfK/SrfK